MSSPITVQQHPLQLTASKVDHVYTFTSTTPVTNPTYTDFRFVADIYVDTTTNYPVKIARQIFAPNSYGKGIINVQRIIENYVEGNARSESVQYSSRNSNAFSPYGTLANLSGASESNAFSDRNCGGCLNNQSYPQRYGVRDYRIMIGEQYIDPADPTTTVVNISQDPTRPHSGFYTTVSNQPASWGPSGANSVNWEEAGGNISQTSGLARGVEYAWTDNSGTVVYAAGVNQNVSGVFTPATNPTQGDLFKVEERYTGIRFTFAWYQASGTYIGWGLLSVSQGFECDYGPASSPPFVTIWPGTSLKQGSYIDDRAPADYWNTGAPVEQQQFWEVQRYIFQNVNPAFRTPRYGEFLTTFGPDTKDYPSDPIAGTVTNSRYRRHHPECPILVSFFSGVLSNDTTLPFINDIEVVNYLFQEATDTNYTSYIEIPINSMPPSPYDGITRQDERIRYTNLIKPELAGGKVGVWAGDADLGQWDQTGIRSEFVVYNMDEASCMSDPVHVLFLNRQGVFDTYTFDRKALESKKIKRDSYAQGGISDTNFFSQLSTERRDVLYNQELKTAMNVETWWLTDNDKAIVMDLFQSPEVYIIKNQEFEIDGFVRGAKSYNPYLLPVTDLDGSIKEFKNRYNKLFQYGFKFEYSSINEYRTQG